MSVTRTTGPGAAALKRLMMDAERLSVRVGWTEAARYEDGTPVAVAAANNEFGDPGRGIPPRPFMRPAAAKNGAEWQGIGERLFRRAAQGGLSVRDALDLLGSRVTGDVARSIAAVTDPPLAPATVAARASRTATGQAGAKPLVDTGVMLNSLTHEVVGGEGGQ